MKNTINNKIYQNKFNQIKQNYYLENIPDHSYLENEKGNNIISPNFIMKNILKNSFSVPKKKIFKYSISPQKNNNEGNNNINIFNLNPINSQNLKRIKTKNYYPRLTEPNSCINQMNSDFNLTLRNHNDSFNFIKKDNLKFKSERNSKNCRSKNISSNLVLNDSYKKINVTKNDNQLEDNKNELLIHLLIKLNNNIENFNNKSKQLNNQNGNKINKLMEELSKITDILENQDKYIVQLKNSYSNRNIINKDINNYINKNNNKEYYKINNEIINNDTNDNLIKEKEINKLIEENNKYKLINSNLRKKIDTSENKNIKLEKKCQFLKNNFDKEKSNFNFQINEKIKEINEKNKEINEYKNKILSLNNELFSYKKKLNELLQKNKELKNQRNDLQNNLIKKVNEICELNDYIKNKFNMNNSNSIKNSNNSFKSKDIDYREIEKVYNFSPGQRKKINEDYEEFKKGINNNNLNNNS